MYYRHIKYAFSVANQAPYGVGHMYIYLPMLDIKISTYLRNVYILVSLVVDTLISAYVRNVYAI